MPPPFDEKAKIENTFKLVAWSRSSYYLYP